MNKSHPTFHFLLLVLALVLFAAGTALADFGDGKVEHMVDLNGDLLVKITDPDGIKSYLIREMRNGRLLAQGTGDCELAQTEIVVRIPRATTGPITGSVSVFFEDCKYVGDEEVWAFSGIEAGWTKATQINPPPRPTPPPDDDYEMIIIIIVIIIMGIVIIIVIIWRTRKK